MKAKKFEGTKAKVKSKMKELGSEERKKKWHRRATPEGREIRSWGKGPHRGRTKHVQTSFKDFFTAGPSRKKLK